MNKIHIKSDDEIKIMREGGKILSDVVDIVLKATKPGVTLLELDRLAQAEIKKRGAEPSFFTVEDYKWALCTCVNDVVVHGIPNDYVLKNNDIVGIDCGVLYKGLHTDSAWTIALGEKTPEVETFLNTGIEALEAGIKQTKPGNYIYDISKAIQQKIEGKGYSIMKSLIGHGVGKELHEDPPVPGFAKGERTKTYQLKEGLTIAIEVIYALGGDEIEYRKDGWTIATRDGTIAGLFEATVAVDAHGCFLLTKKYGTSGNN